jgi:hypothetical protein
MKKLAAIVAVFALVGVTVSANAADIYGETGFSRNTTIVGGPYPDQDEMLMCNDDGGFENGYCWQYGGCVEPYYGAWAEQYFDKWVIVALHLGLTQAGGDIGQTLDAYVWEDDGGDNPGNVLYMEADIDPGPIAFWPSISMHKIYFINPPWVFVHWWVGWWGNWPGVGCGWYVAADEDGFGGYPRTNIAPGIGYPTGWQHPNVVPTFGGCQALGICVWVIPSTATETTTWGQIKALY